jgi:hypothetical protein
MALPGCLKDCVLVFGTPISREEFERACQRIPRADYVANLLGVDGDPEKAWHSLYATVAETAQQLIAVASALGAVVCREATLSDLAYATIHREVVILMAHFKGFDVVQEDLVGPLDRIIAAIESGSHPALAYFKQVTREPGSLVDAFNIAVMDRKLLSYLPRPLEDAGRLSISVGRVLCRDLLDEAFAELIRPGNQIELFDGLHSPGAVERAIWSEFKGELDLTLCNSVALATYIDLRRRNLVRHLHWPDLVDPVPQFILIGETLRRLSRQGGSYIALRMRLETEMLQSDWSLYDNTRNP